MTASRPWPAGDPSKTVRLIGDVHQGNIGASRQTMAQRNLAKPMVPTVAATIQLGDAVNNGLTSEDAAYLAWKAGLPASTGTFIQALGNHDILNDVRTPTQAAAALGMPGQNYAVDLGFITVLVVFPGDGFAAYNSGSIFTDATLNWIYAAAAAASSPCVIANHFPLYETVLGDGATQFLSTDSGFYAATQAATANSSGVLAMLADLPSIVAWLNGHTHSSLPTDGFVTSKRVANRNVPCVNASAYVSVDKASGVSQYTLGPIHSPEVTFYEDKLEVRYRAISGGGLYCARTGLEKVTTVTF